MANPAGMRTTARSPWTALTLVAWPLTAIGWGVYLSFASEEADRQNSGELVSGGVRAGVIIGGVLFLAGLALLVVEGVRRGIREDHLLVRLAGQLLLAVLAVLAGSVVMYVIVHAVFA